MSIALVLCTCPDSESAGLIARTLVDERLAACVSEVPGVRSTYRWQGKVIRDDEVLLAIKTTRARHGDVERRITSLHPAELPEIVVVDVVAGLQRYLRWVEEAVD